MLRFLILLSLPLFLTACAEPVWAPDEAVARAVYREPGPPTITLFTMVSNRNGSGGHSAMMVNASQRVIFDPAGTWWHRLAPERNDVHFGITPVMLGFYIDYHARETYHVVMQTKEVSPEVAERALRLVETNGAVPKAFCGRSVSGVLRQLPGFEKIPRALDPKRIMRAFGKLPDVTTEEVYDNDPDENDDLLHAQQQAAPAAAVPD